MYKLYGIPNCDTVKKARTFLLEHHFAFDFIDFKKIPPDARAIERWKSALGEFPVNTKGVTYKKYKAKFETLKDKDKVTFLIEHSSMIKRPILEKGEEVLSFGFNADTFKEKLWIK